MASNSKKRLQLKRRSQPQQQEDDELNWEGLHDYMTIKTKKLRSQVEMLCEQKSSIFEGVTIYVNGYTQPNTDELKEMIHLHGGLYEYALSSSVTHVIATNLPTAKIKNLRDVVCKPEWITDSVEAGKRLPVHDYLLYNISNNQRRILFSEVTTKKNIDEHQAPSSSDTDKDNLQANRSKDFVSEFYSHSRLHYLSTWSRELRDFTSRVLSTATQIIPRVTEEESLRGCGTRVFVHVDVDCFFVSVSLLNKPHLKGKPVAVTHAKNASSSPSKLLEHHTDSMSDIASCSYEARKLGVKNGMLVGTALNKCPELILIPYDFEKYRAVSQILYETLISYSDTVEAVSCDEAYIELTDYVRNPADVLDIVQQLRSDVFNKTGCRVSAGISHNVLLARLATSQAKPNGQFLLSEEDVQTYLIDKLVSSLPGVGWALNKKLKEYEIDTCGQLQLVSLDTLKKRHGVKTGEMLYYYCRGIDLRELKLSREKKSLSVDINYGIRFKKLSEAVELLLQLGKELENRLKECDMKGECVCLKLKVRKATAANKTKKYLGHGPCNNVSRSFNLTKPANDGAEIGQIACRLLKQIKAPISDIRGVGIQLTKLQVTHTSSATPKENDKRDIRSLMSIPSTSSSTLYDNGIPVDELKTVDTPSLNQASTSSLNDSVYHLPPLGDLDHSVLLALPADMQDKILNEYSSRSCQEFSNIPDHSVTQHQTEENTRVEFFEIRIISKIQSQYVTELRNNIRKWVTQSNSGPSQAETESFYKYVCWLAEENFEVVYLALKCLKRVIVSRQLVKEWSSLFNDSLTIVQSKLLTQKHSGLMDISPIV